MTSRKRRMQMRILVVGPQFPDSFARNIAVTLRAMGHQAITENGTNTHHHGNRYWNAFWRSLRRGFASLESWSYEALVRRAKALQPDLVLITYGVMPPQVVAKLREECGIKVACWFTDAISNLHRQYLLASPFDALFLKEPSMVRTFREKLGLNAYYLPEACNPQWHKPPELTDAEGDIYDCDVAAVGSFHYYRARMLEGFEGYNLRIWGNNCPPWINSPIKSHYAHHYIAEDEKAKAYRSAKVLVNTISYSEIEGVNCTLFEAAGCGAFQIADWKPALPNLFEPEEEIVTFRTRHELKEKVDYYLAHPEERQEIADRAYARAHREHTYELRIRKMLEALGSACEPARFSWNAMAPEPIAQQIT
jgi:spore maturation protein CgeB